MFTKYELLDGVNEIMEGKHTIQNCERLAAIYTVLDHLYPENAEKTALNVQNEGYSYDNKVLELISSGVNDTNFVNIGNNKVEIKFKDSLTSLNDLFTLKIYDLGYSKNIINYNVAPNISGSKEVISPDVLNNSNVLS